MPWVEALCVSQGTMLCADVLSFFCCLKFRSEFHRQLSDHQQWRSQSVTHLGLYSGHQFWWLSSQVMVPEKELV